MRSTLLFAVIAVLSACDPGPEGQASDQLVEVQTQQAGLALSLSNGLPVSVSGNAYGFSQAFQITVPAQASSLVFSTSGGTGSVVLYEKLGAEPTMSDYDSTTVAFNVGKVKILFPAAGTYFVKVFGYSAFSGVNLTAQFVPNGASGMAAGTGGFINLASSGGLTWYRDVSALRHAGDAVTWAGANTPLENSGWRLPTLAEAQALIANRASVSTFNSLSVWGNYIVTSTPAGTGLTYGIRLSDGSLFIDNGLTVGYTTLVRPAVNNLVEQGGLIWLRDNTSPRSVGASSAFCAALMGNIGVSGGQWRMPSQSEATNFVAARASISLYQAWINSFGDYLMTSTAVSGGNFGIKLSTGVTFASTGVGYNACVRPAY